MGKHWEHDENTKIQKQIKQTLFICLWVEENLKWATEFS
jgi:hypothetical protein